MKLSVGSASEWERLVAEGEVEGKIGFVVSDERAGEFKVSLFLLAKDDEDFAFCRNQDERTVDLDTLIAALGEARRRLEAL